MLQKDPFTTTVLDSIEESTRTHNEYSETTKSAINQQNLNIRTYVSELASFAEKMDNNEVPKLVVPELTKLRDSLVKVEANKSDWKVGHHEAVSLYNIVQQKITGNFELGKFISNFGNNFRKVETALSELVKSISKNLDSFLENLLALAARHNKNQAKLYKEMRIVLNEFDTIYNYVFDEKESKFQTVNNLYSSVFHEFENDMVPFTEIIYEEFNVAKLTYTDPVNLRLPRVYYCNLQAYMMGMSSFNVKFEFVDRLSDSSENILAKTEDLRGGFRDPVSVNEVLMFEVQEGPHNFYLRVLSKGTSSQLRIKDMLFECLSYRNFHMMNIFKSDLLN